MNKISTLFFIALSAAGIFILAGCDTEENMMDPDTDGEASYTMTLQIEPTTALRTQETWNNWTEPVEITFDATSGEINQSTGMMKIQHTDGDTLPADSVMYIGSMHTGGMDISAAYGNGRDFWERQHSGMMEHHPHQQGAHHYQIQILDDAITSEPHGGMTIPYSEVTLLAITNTDTTEIPLEHAHGGHGFRYESNAELPFGTYDLKVVAQPPNFYRLSENAEKWTTEFTTTFTNYAFEEELTAIDSIGSELVVNTDNDSMNIGLTAGPVKTYGAPGVGEISTDGKTINFSVHLEDPSLPATANYLYDCIVNVTVENESTGETETQTLKPTYGPNGFYFGENMQFEMPGEMVGQREHMMGGHGPGGGHMGGPGGGMMQ